MNRAPLLARKLLVAATFLSIALGPDGAPPKEFRIFAKGWNETTKGRFLFDDKAAQEVMSAYAKHGVDVMIDLEHGSLSSQPSPDPTARDARGWCQLALRNGELWAVNVRWTPDGSERLSQLRQRYCSPAFGFDPETREIFSILNIAITSMPATDNAPALMAASLLMASAKGNAMDPSLIAKALDALEAGDSKAALEILKGLIASAAGGGTSDPSAAPGGGSDGGDDPPVATNGDIPQPAEPNVVKPPAGDKKKDPMMAAAHMACAITGLLDPGEAIAELARRSTVALDLEKREEGVRAAQLTLEMNTRKENAAKLVKLGAETPHTSGLATGKLAKRLVDEPLKEQTARVNALLAARGGKFPASPTPPTSIEVGTGTADGGDLIATLSQRELAKCAEKKIDPVAYAKTKAAIAAKSNAPRAQGDGQ